MPYTRKGKCVYKQPTGEKVGCSDTVSKAKKYIQALYASEINEGLANTISPEELAKVEEYMAAFMDNKEEWIKNYGIDQANFVMYKTAVKKAKKEMEKKDKNIDENKLGVLRELIKDALKNPKKADLDNNNRLSKYEKARGAAIEKNLNEDNIGLADIEEMGYEAGVEAFEMVSNSMNFKNSPDFKAYKQGFFQGFIDESSAQGLYEDLDLGHQDNEPGMLKGDLYKIGKYAMELYKMMDSLEGMGEVDFPHWWQSKITTAKNMISGAKHYLDFEMKEPQIDATLDEIGMFNDPIGYEKSEPNPKDLIFTKKFVGTSDTKGHAGYIYDIYKNGVKIKTIEGEGEANAYINQLKREMNEGMSEEEFADAQESERLSKLSKSDQDKIKKMIKMIRAEKESKKSLNEFGPMAGSGNRNYSTNDLVDRIGDLDDILMSDRKAEREWEEISQNYLDGQSGSEYWGDLGDQELQNAIDDAESLMKKYRIKESVNEGPKKQLNEYTDNDFSGNALIAQTPQPGRDELEAFDDFFPNGVASRENAVASLQSHDKSGIKARMGRYAPMFVHVQYHDFQDAAGEKYRVHQKQFYNSNFKDKDPNFNPSVTKLSLTKLADPSNPSPQSQKDINMGSILVKTDEYIKDLKNLDITNRQS